MLLVFLVIVLAAFGFGCLLMSKSSHESDYSFYGIGIFVIFGALLIVVVGTSISCMYEISQARVIDAKIEMYQEENEKIESYISDVVKQYQEYEHNTFVELNHAESAITLVSLYPELKADSLVSTQIDTYVVNAERIRELKSDKLDISVYRWWLYFGR